MRTFIAILAIAIGIAVMVACDRRKSQMLRATLRQTDPERQLAALRFPYNEVLLGLLMVLAIVYCAVKCLPIGQDGCVAFSIGHLAAILTSYGTYQRIRKALDELGQPTLETTVIRLVAGFCCGMAAFLSGALILARQLLLY